MRYALDIEVGGHDVIAIWDTEEDRGRLIWMNGNSYDLIRPRDNKLIERVLAKGAEMAPSELSLHSKAPVQQTLF